MVPEDLNYVRKFLESNPNCRAVLELGAGSIHNCREEITSRGIGYTSTDLHSEGSGECKVDVAADFEQAEHMARFSGKFDAILVLNVLEHTFDPIRILDNATTLLAAGGSLVLSTPSVWPLHNYPIDAWRILPNFYEQYAERRGMSLSRLEYPGHGAVADFRNADGSYCYPPPCKPGVRKFVSRVVHRMFNTFGRGALHPCHLSVAAVMSKP